MASNNSALVRSQLTASLAATDPDPDLMWDLQCAISDATDCDGITDDTLRSALEHHGLVVSRKPPPVRCSEAQTYTIQTWKRTP